MHSTRPRAAAKTYLVGLPIAALDAEGEQLPRSAVREWSARVAEALTEWFGGATILPAQGTSAVVDGEAEQGQKLVLAACDSRQAFLARRGQVLGLAEELRQALRQESVLVLAFASDSFLVEEGP
jgi:hypothetical protein